MIKVNKIYVEIAINRINLEVDEDDIVAREVGNRAGLVPLSEDGGGTNMARGLHRKRCNNGHGIGGWFGSLELVFGFIDLLVLDFVILIRGFVHSWVMFWNYFEFVGF